MLPSARCILNAMKLGLFKKMVWPNLWLKEHEHALKMEIPELTTPAKNVSNASKNLPTGQKGKNARDA